MIDDRDGAEWNTTAMGPTKRVRAADLLGRLYDRFAQGGLLHFGQGKWYPGESLPRWSFGCWWRKDGHPIWRDPSLIAKEDATYGYGPDDAAAFIQQLARQIGVDPGNATASYEDAYYYMWKERLLPSNVDVMKSRLENPEERARIAKVFDPGPAERSSATPYRCAKRERATRGDVWQSSSRWLRCRRENLFLLPGDSPMGYRLPLDSLPWETPGLRSTVIEDDPWAERGELPVYGRSRQMSYPVGTPSNGQPPGSSGPSGPSGPSGSSGSDAVVRMALCVEPRKGRLHVFMPPQRTAEDYLALVSAIEATAKSLLMPVTIEGYTPPFDPRLLHFRITPDPGVIEVNVQPAHDWPELTDLVTTVYEEAKNSRLSAEKFMLDGRHVGTGGGNHIVLGGPTPADSPVLRRPDLLRSLVTYWHNHPSLSYLFSGLFVGPTSQAPRVDEARNDSLYELEIAGGLTPDRGGTPPWLVDRLYRNLLDRRSPRNTHRAEWCIDKLYSPDSSTGRLGLVEFRGFEMPPHSRMSLTQQLLVRTLVARFWKSPYQQTLVRWGTQLHDRFMLPHFIEQDFRDVLEETRRAGYRLDDAWFAPHAEFRFPTYGTIAPDGVRLEIRQAIEPWHVLGEETTATGTARSRRFVGRTLASQGPWSRRTSPRRRLQRPQGAAPSHRGAGRIRGRRPLPGVAAAVVSAADDPGACAARVRSVRFVDGAVARGMHLSRRPRRRPASRHVAGQLERGGRTPHRPVRADRSHAGVDADPAGRAGERVADDARSAAAAAGGAEPSAGSDLARRRIR